MRSPLGIVFLTSTLFPGAVLPFLRLGPWLQRMARSMALAFVIFGLGASASCSHEGVIDNGLSLGLMWAGECRIHRPCKDISPLPPCPLDMKTSTPPVPATLPPKSEMTYSVAGRLQFGPNLYTEARCAPSWRQHCCNHGSKEAVLVVEDGSSLALPKVGCFGDESRLCCNVPVKEQKVVATGVMQVKVWSEAMVDWRWGFQDEVTLCAL
jgi:hypothetical protein